MTVGVIGLGRSGLAVGRAALARGDRAIVVDRAAGPESLPKPELAEEAVKAGLDVRFGTDDPGPVDLLVPNPAIRRDHPAILAALARDTEVISEPEFASRIAKAPIVAVTGTNGKSTTVVMTWNCLIKAGMTAYLCGNLMGSGYEEMTLTEAAMIAGPNDFLVAEISSFQLEWVRDFRPACAGITNIRPDHLDRHPSFEDYRETKLRLFRCMADPDRVVVRAHDPEVRVPGAPSVEYRPRSRRRAEEAARDENAPVLLTFGATGEHGEIREDGLRILDTLIPYRDLPFSEPLNHVNAVMAALLSYGAMAAVSGENAQARNVIEAAGVGKLPPGIAEGLRTYGGIRHRMQTVGRLDGTRYVNNSMCTNVDALVASIQALKDPAHILVGGVNKGLDFAPFGRYVANRRHRVYLYGRDGGQVNERTGADWPVFGTLDEAFAAARAAARPDEVVVLSPGMASSDQFTDFRERGDRFVTLAREAGVS